MNQKIFLTNPLSKYDEIKTKTIIHIDTHQELPYILFSDKENTIFISFIIIIRTFPRRNNNKKFKIF